MHQRCEKHPKRKLKNGMKTHDEIFEANPKKLTNKLKLHKTYKVDPESYSIQNLEKEEKNSFSSKHLPLKVAPIKIKIKLKSKNLESGRLKSYQSVKYFSCKFCTKSFSEAGNLKKHLKDHVKEVQHEIANLDESTKNDSMLQEKFGIKPVMVVLYRVENEICRSMKVKTKTHLHSKKLKKEPVDK